VTTVLSWVGVDQRGCASIYIASDSRFTWPDGSFWDHGRKLFSSKLHPELFAFCGEAQFPPQVLGQIVELIDCGVLIDVANNPAEKLTRVRSILCDALSDYPNSYRADFDILYCSRLREGKEADFQVVRLEFRSNSLSAESYISLPQQSDEVAILGSGTDALRKQLAKWNKSDSRQTSRAMFSAFCDTLESKDDPKSGGSPQLVGLYRVGAGKTFGITLENKGFIAGVDVLDAAALNAVDWHNRLFEKCDGETKSRLPEAMPQPRPKMEKN
jgi:hypothetical protein